MKSQMKRFLVMLGVVALISVAAVVLVQQNIGKTTQKQTIKVGVSTYRSNDVFVSEMVAAMEKAAKELERETGVKVILEVSGAKGNQRVQNDHIKRYIALDYDVICVNLVDRTDATVIIDTAMEAQKPVVFFNREPVMEDIFRGEKTYYVGSDAKATAVAQGEMLIDAYAKDKSKIDRNGDGMIQYVMLEGEMGHQDAIIRTEWSVGTLVSQGLQVEKLDSAVANWDRSQAAVHMEQWLKTYGERIEVVFCNNDEMALGAAQAIEKAGLDGIAVLGIDSTQAGEQAVRDGKLLGTVDCNADNQGKAIFELAVELAYGHNPADTMEITGQRYLRVPVEKVTK